MEKLDRASWPGNATNAAEWVGMVRDAAIEYLTPEAGAPFVAECDALFDAESLPGVADTPNPLRDKLEWELVGEPGSAEAVQTRKVCCLSYLLADRFGRLCGNCPYLPLEDRLALIHERHGVPMGNPGARATSGAAEQQAIQRGLERPSARQVLRALRRDGR